MCHVSVLFLIVLAPASRPAPFPRLVDGLTAFMVQRLLGARPRGWGFQYLVDWEGYGPEDRSWDPARDILDPALIADFRRCHPGQPGVAPGRSPCGARYGGGGVLSHPVCVFTCFVWPRPFQVCLICSLVWYLVSWVMFVLCQFVLCVSTERSRIPVLVLPCALISRA